MTARRSLASAVQSSPRAANDNKKLADWLKAKEPYILPRWAREVRSQSRERDRILSTEQFKHQHLVSFYDGLITASETGELVTLERLLEEMVYERIQQAYNIDEILLFPQQLRATVREYAAATELPDHALGLIGALEPLLDQTVSILVRSFTDLSKGLLNERLAEAEFMAQNLQQANEEAARSLMQLRTLYRVSRELSRTFQIEQTLGLVAEHLVAVFALDRCAIWLAQKDGTLFAAVVHGQAADQLEGLVLQPDTRSFVSEAFRRQQHRLVEDRLDGRPLDDPLGDHFRLRSVLAMPLASEGEAIGVITVDGLSEAQPFDVSTIDMIRSVAEQAAVAIKTAHLYDQLTRFNQELEQRVRQQTQELESAMRELEHLERTKSDFISIAAHELKTPLTLILGYTNILKDLTEMQSPEIAPLMQGIIAGGERLRAIIEDLIDVSLIDTEVLTLRFLPASLDRVVELTLREFKEALMERQLTLTTRGLDELPYIECDAQRLYQVLVNIVGNAVKYTPDGGRIEVAARLLTGRKAGDPDFVEVTVTDTGIGIDPEHHERIFQKFHQIGNLDLHSSGKTKFKGGGPGLGLAIAKGVVEAHGGKVWVESEGYDEERYPGSTFHVVLPVKATSPLEVETVKRVLSR